MFRLMSQRGCALGGARQNENWQDRYARIAGTCHPPHPRHPHTTFGTRVTFRTVDLRGATCGGAHRRRPGGCGVAARTSAQCGQRQLAVIAPPPRPARPGFGGRPRRGSPRGPTEGSKGTRTHAPSHPAAVSRRATYAGISIERPPSPAGGILLATDPASVRPSVLPTRLDSH